MVTIKEYLDKNKLIYGYNNRPPSKNTKAQMRKKGKWRYIYKGTSFDEIETPKHKSNRFIPEHIRNLHVSK